MSPLSSLFFLFSAFFFSTQVFFYPFLKTYSLFLNGIMCFDSNIHFKTSSKNCSEEQNSNDLSRYSDPLQYFRQLLQSTINLVNNLSPSISLTKKRAMLAKTVIKREPNQHLCSQSNNHSHFVTNPLKLLILWTSFNDIISF